MSAAAPKEEKLANWKTERYNLKQKIIQNNKQMETLAEENKKLSQKIEMLTNANAKWQTLRIGEECQDDDPCSHEVWLDGKSLGWMDAPEIVKLYELHEIRIPSHLLE